MKSVLFVLTCLVLSSCASGGFALLPKGTRDRREERERRYSRRPQPEPPSPEPKVETPAPVVKEAQATLAELQQPLPELSKELPPMEKVEMPELPVALTAAVAEQKPVTEQKPVPAAEPVKMETQENSEYPVVFNKKYGTTATDDRNILLVYEDRIEFKTISFGTAFGRRAKIFSYDQISNVSVKDNTINADLRIETKDNDWVHFEYMPREDAARAKQLIQKRIEKIRS